jgi:hypothetical protein
VWDYPRPPAVTPCDRRVRVEWAGEVLADSINAPRVLETSHPPTIYIPPADVRMSLLAASGARPKWCEFKGDAVIWMRSSPGNMHSRSRAATRSQLRALMQTMERNRLRRLQACGFSAATARHLSDLHTPNLM